MHQISIYLEKFKNAETDAVSAKTAIIEAVFEVVKRPLKKENVSFENGRIKIMAGPALKSEIFMRQKEVFAAIESKIGRKIEKFF
ncbi:MAG: hypothetical protein Q8P86_02590 [bacterium]|nr:hypothetical protein [bacterium]